MYIKRCMEATILNLTAMVPVLLVTGPKQVGKTTLLQHCSEKNRGYVSLEDHSQRALANSNPKLFFEKNPYPILIDDIQHSPNLLQYICLLCENKCVPGSFWLAGLKDQKLTQLAQDLLPDKAVTLTLLGLSQAEILGHAEYIKPLLPSAEWLKNTRKHAKDTCSLIEIYKRIWTGSFPQLFLNPKIERELFYTSYVREYIQYVNNEIINIPNLKVFNNFLRMVAASSGHLLNYAVIARNAGVNLKTAKIWLEILESTGVIYLLPQYHNHADNSSINSLKLYFLDTGLCCYLTKCRTVEALAGGVMSGHILETYVMAEILKSYMNNRKKLNFFFYRDRADREIDLLIEQNDMVYPIEMKKTSAPTANSAINFKYLLDFKQKIGRGMVICLAAGYLSLAEEVDAVPVSYL